MGRNRNLKKLLTIYTKIFKFIQPEPLSLVIVGAVGSVTTLVGFRLLGRDPASRSPIARSASFRLANPNVNASTAFPPPRSNIKQHNYAVLYY